ncbi:hypothetical protein RCL_jg20487.t1 [Rhizophagus clarus]|uniref:Integrase catalytic domain-containing protein n=1 Tax=Rhizophagus clarus TaxID=94130 RepID=A0A8H3QLH6_9GLOM|nr:hypothetical protein RCL_jg20487.t1 [Rhizophagus clarus]
MGEPVIYIDPQKARKLDQIIAKQTPTINIDPQKAHNLDQHLALQKLYYRPEGLYQNVKGLWNACKKAGYSFSFINVKKWLENQAMYQIFRPSPKHIPYASYSKITKPNTVHQCDLIEIPYDSSSKEVAEAFKSIYDNPDKPHNWPRKLQCDKGTEFIGYVTLLMDEHGVEIRRIIAYFRHTSFAMIDNYARHFSRRVFKNQRIVDNINDSLTRLIGMSPNDTTKLERIYSKPSVKYNHPIGVDEPQLPKGTTIRFLLAPGEKNPPMPILYYLDESGPQRPFVREQLMHIKEEPMLPPRWVLGYNQMHTRRSL